MADESDIAQEYEQASRDRALANALKKNYMEPGTQGDCELCGEWSGRLVRAACAPCRDKYRLP